jgi:hypothetical protein
LAPTNNFESGIVAVLPEGAYSVIMRGTDGPGVGLISVDELLTSEQLRATGDYAFDAAVDAAFTTYANKYSNDLGATDGPSRSIAGYRYRTYSGAHTLAVNEEGIPHVFYSGPLSGGNLLDLGVLAVRANDAR